MMIHMQCAAQHNGDLFEFRSLSWFDPSFRRNHPRDADSRMTRTQASGKFFDALGLVAGGWYDGRRVNQYRHVLILLLSTVTRLSAQEPPPKCPAAELHRFDFLIGDWHGREYNFLNGSKDSTAGDEIVARNRKLSYGCAFEEHWEFTANGVVAFASQPSDSGWVFRYDIPGPKPHRLHIKWIATQAGYTEVIQVSSDSGRTWPIVRHLNYARTLGSSTRPR